MLINTYMKDAYHNAFRGVVQETQEQSGLTLPAHLESYIVMLLAHHIDNPKFEPTDSFAQRYLDMQKRTDAKTLGDTCLFVVGVFPTYGKRKGLNTSYYTRIGQGSYSSIRSDLFEDLATHFVFLSQFIQTTVNSSKQTPSILFR